MAWIEIKTPKGDTEFIREGSVARISAPKHPNTGCTLHFLYGGTVEIVATATEFMATPATTVFPDKALARQQPSTLRNR